MAAERPDVDLDARLEAICTRIAFAQAEDIERGVMEQLPEEEQLRLYAEALVFMARTLGYRIEISTSAPGAADLGGAVSVVSIWPRRGAAAAVREDPPAQAAVEEESHAS